MVAQVRPRRLSSAPAGQNGGTLPHEVYHLPVGTVDAFVLERFQIGLGNGDGRMAHSLRDDARMHAAVVGRRGPRVAGGVRAEPCVDAQTGGQRGQVAVDAAQGRLVFAVGSLGVLGRVEDLVRSIPPVRRARLAGTRARRRVECLAELPVLLDVVTLGLSAGLSFDSSLELYCERCANELARSLEGAMLSWRIGVAGREEALLSLAEELDLAPLGRFAAVVGESLAFGAPLAAALERQARAMRDEQRSQVEEEIEKVPVKMLVPLGTLIVPAMFLAILGPLLGSAVVVG